VADGLVLRADAGLAIGTGHVMRCLALAQAWRAAGGRPAFVSRIDAPALTARLAAEGFEVHDVAAPAGSPDDAEVTRRAFAAEWIVTDGRAFGPAYHAILRTAGARVLAIDDAGTAERVEADLTLNQNLHADAGLYPRVAPHAELLLGSSFVLLRDEFLETSRVPRPTRAGPIAVLVTLGGADPGNHTADVLGALQRIEAVSLEVTVVLGAGRADDGPVPSGRHPVRVVRRADDMASLMAAADLAVTAGGTTVWELAFMGVPSLVGTVAPVEELLVRGLRAAGLFVDLGPFDRLDAGTLARAVERLAHDPAARAAMRDRVRAAVDGRGRERVLDRMTARKGALHA
jgi:UDP-2,4-diacetamido-2,4,6-trideoxy-beta-L-altropyranose hydrolase